MFGQNQECEVKIMLTITIPRHLGIVLVVYEFKETLMLNFCYVFGCLTSVASCQHLSHSYHLFSNVFSNVSSLFEASHWEAVIHCSLLDFKGYSLLRPL